MTYILNDKINPKPLKALYHLGAYDSQDGKIRQTGYRLIKDYACEKTNNNRFYIGSVPLAQKPSADTSIANFKVSGTFTVDTARNVYNNSTENIIGMSVDGGLNVFVSATYYANHTAEQFLADYGDIQIQYQLANGYPDNGIIENQSILPLDTNMANKIRQKVVDGLNLISAIYQGNGTPDPTMTIRVTAEAELKANQTYHLSLSSSATNTAVYIYYNGTLVRMGDTNELDFSFTTPYTGEHHIIFMAGGGSGIILVSNISNVMLNEGNHPYPHSQFNQKEHITNAQAELLKSEEEKVKNIYNKSKLVYINGGWCFPLSGFVVGKKYSYNIISSLAQVKISTNPSGPNTWQSSLAKNTFTMTSEMQSLYFIVLDSNYVATNTTQCMLTPTDTPEPYHEYCGEIVHEADIPPVYWVEIHAAGRDNYGSQYDIIIAKATSIYTESGSFATTKTLIDYKNIINYGHTANTKCAAIGTACGGTCIGIIPNDTWNWALVALNSTGSDGTINVHQQSYYTTLDVACTRIN